MYSSLQGFKSHGMAVPIFSWNGTYRHPIPFRPDIWDKEYPNTWDKECPKMSQLGC